jgi:hypothetical protein
MHTTSLNACWSSNINEASRSPLPNASSPNQTRRQLLAKCRTWPKPFLSTYVTTECKFGLLFRCYVKIYRPEKASILICIQAVEVNSPQSKELRAPMTQSSSIFPPKRTMQQDRNDEPPCASNRSQEVLTTKGGDTRLLLPTIRSRLIFFRN